MHGYSTQKDIVVRHTSHTQSCSLNFM